MRGEQICCIDTSALVTGYRRVYPHHVFAGLWVKMHDLVEEGRLVAPEEVAKELEAQDDALTMWMKQHRKMFIRPDYHQTAFLSRIAVDFPRLATSPVAANRADPWVVALAQTRGYMVVSEEKRESIRNPKIPQICRHYHVSHIPFLNIILAEGWVFT